MVQIDMETDKAPNPRTAFPSASRSAGSIAARDPMLRSIETPITNGAGDVDLEQLRHRLSLSPADRIRENVRFARFLDVVRRAGAVGSR